MSNKIIEYKDLKQKLTNEKIMEVALESDDPIIKQMVIELMTITKLLHSDEVKTKVDNILAAYGFIGFAI